MSIAQLFHTDRADSEVRLFQDEIVGDDEAGGVLLSGGERAITAAGCILRPSAGDQVLVCRLSSGQCFVSQILTRADGEAAHLEVSGSSSLHIHGRELHMLADRQMSLSSLGDMEWIALGGRINLQAQDMVLSISHSLIELIYDRISNVHNWLMEAKSLFRFHGEHGVVTADKDIRMDAERINMG